MGGPCRIRERPHPLRDGRMHRDQPVPAVLRLAQREDACLQVHIGLAERACLAAPQPGRVEHPEDERLLRPRRCGIATRERVGRREERGKLPVGEDVRLVGALPGAPRACGRHPCVASHARHPGGEAPSHARPAEPRRLGLAGPARAPGLHERAGKRIAWAPHARMERREPGQRPLLLVHPAAGGAPLRDVGGADVREAHAPTSGSSAQEASSAMSIPR